MQYRQLGKAGIKVSELSLGPWLTFSKHLSVKKTTEMMRIAYDQGINLFDNAERYAEGMAESLMGEVLKHFRRESIVVTTKIFWGGSGPNDVGLSRKHLIEGTKNALRRLQMDYVDLLYCHRPDSNTPIEEIVYTMDILIRQGYALYWGTSEWPAKDIESAYQLAKNMHCIPPSMEQPPYNLFERQWVEKEYRTLCQEQGMGLITSSPLAFGILSGKYSQGIPVDSRLATQERLIQDDFSDRLIKVDAMQHIAASLTCSAAQLALAWCLSNEQVSSIIMGASNEKQLLENIQAVELKNKITPEVHDALNAVFY